MSKLRSIYSSCYSFKSYINGEISKEQLAWLDNEVAKTSERDVILIFSHVPIIEPYPSEHHKLLNSSEVLKHLYSYKLFIAIILKESDRFKYSYLSIVYV